MSYSFRPAVRDNTALILGFIGASGSGKTYTGVEVAVGLAYPGMTDAEIIAAMRAEGRSRVAFIDTERGRALHYAPPPGREIDRSKGWFPFDHLELEPPFRPSKYSEAIKAAEAAGYRAIIVDSASHEWSGEGGVLGYQGEEQYAIAKRGMGDREPDWRRLEQVKAASWIKPKGEHNDFIGVLTTRKAHIIVCLRAKQVVELKEINDNGRKKTVWISAKDRPINERWTPICHEDFPFELTMSFLLTPDRPGFGIPLKLQAQHRPFIDLERPLGIETGASLAAWSAGATEPSQAPSGGGSPPPSGGGQKRTPEQLTDAYCDRVRACKDRASLMALQQEDAVGKFLAQLRDRFPDLHGRTVEANSRRFAELADDDRDPAKSEDLEWPDDLLTANDGSAPNDD